MFWCVQTKICFKSTQWTVTTIDNTRKNADTVAEKGLIRTTFAEMKSSLSQSNVLKQAANEKQEKFDTVNS